MSASIVAGNLRPNGKTIQRILLGHITDAPAMVPDEQVEKCMVSQEAFSMFNRRHHCRHCGCVVSNNFSKRTMPIPKFGLKKAMRVCDPCCDALELAAKNPNVWQQQLHKLAPPASAASIAAFAAAQQARRREARMKDHGMRTAAAKVQSDRLRRNTPTPDIVLNATAATRAGVASGGGGGGGGGVEETAKQRKKRCVRSTTVIAFRANPSHHLTCSP